MWATAERRTLDTVNSTVVMDHLRELHRRGTTVLINTHDPEIAVQADRRIEIRDGVLTELSPGTAPAPPHVDDAGHLAQVAPADVRTDRLAWLTPAAAFVTAPVIAEQPQAQLDLVLRTEVGFPYPVSQAAPLVIAPESPGSVRVQTVADLRQLRAGVSDDLSAFVGVLSGVLLVLAVISASTAMYLSVQTRTAEIALRRAIGSGRGLIARLFLIEGAAVGLAGGALGAAVSTAAVVVVSHLRGWTPVLPASSIPLTLGLGLVSGVLSGLYPAWVASRQRPADALRG